MAFGSQNRSPGGVGSKGKGNPGVAKYATRDSKGNVKLFFGLFGDPADRPERPNYLGAAQNLRSPRRGTVKWYNPENYDTRASGAKAAKAYMKANPKSKKVNPRDPKTW